ncbi:MAG: nitroreductase [Phenylobacterium sp.]|uniref:nitroreductase n=1 Tax=Phenylobacterium sp. TaxID=1871053 RepID=UPI001A459343|nr:nitroreductase [Phenylobacterium sp.]MBL8773043.1 nitroreductase [Phenylobacterium sp.]
MSVAEVIATHSTSVADAVATRRSIRAFLPRPVPFETVRRVLDRARWAPSGCNFQPWEAVVLTGAPLKALQDKLLVSAPDNPQEYDFSAPGQVEKYQARLRAVGAAMYQAQGIVRQDADARAKFVRDNCTSFGAPVLLLCHFPKLMKEAQWSDVGMWLQTIMLLLREEGLDSCPQEYMGVYGRTIKAHLGLGDDILLFCGLAIGWRDETAAVNTFTRERVAVEDHITFQGF